MKTTTSAPMKTTTARNSRRILATSAAALLSAALMLGTAQAYNPNFWDVNGVAAGLGGTGNWDNNTTANWNNATGVAAAQTWITPTLNNNAIFVGTTGVVTLSGADGIVLANSLTFAPTTFAAGAPLGYIVNGPGTLAMSGAGTIQLGAALSPNSTTTINAALTDVGGSGVTVSSFSNSLLDVLTLNGTNTFTGGFTVNSGTVNLNTLGTDSSITGSTLTIGNAGFAAVVNNTAGAAISNNTAVVIGANGTMNIGGSEGVASFSGVAGAKIVLSGSGAIGQNDNTSQTYAGTITGTTTSANAIFKNGTGTLTLSGANNYTGNTNIQSGAVRIANSNALGTSDGTAANGTVVLSGATLQLSGGISVGNEALTLIGVGTGAALQDGALVNVAGNNTFGGALTLTGATTINSAGGAGSLNLSNTAQIAGAFGLTLNANGGSTGTNILAGGLNNSTSLTVNATNAFSVWQLSGNNGSFAGPITVNSGILQAGSANAFGNGLVAVTVNNVGTLDLNGNSETIGSVTGVAGANIFNTSALAATLTTGAAGSTTYGGAISNNAGTGALSLIKQGAGTTFTLTSNFSSYTGLTTVAAGILNIQANNALGAVAAGTVVNNAATLQLQGGITVGAEALTLGGTGAAGQNGALVNVSGTNIYGGALTLSAATTISSDSGTLNLNNTAAVAGGGALTLTGASNGTFAGGLTSPVITSVTKNGAGTWTLGAAGTVNNYAAATTVNAGTLKAGVLNAFGGNSAVSVNGSGILDLAGFNNTIGSLFSGVVSSVVTNSAAATPVTLFTGGDNSTTSFAGSITDNGPGGALSLSKGGTGTFTLTGANNYNGTTLVSAGALNIQNSAALGAATGAAATGTTVFANATLQLQGGIGVGNEFLSLAGAGTGAANVDGALVNVSGVNSFGGPLTLTGATTISSTAGTLNLTNATAIAGAGGALTLNSAAALGGGNLAAVLGANITSLTKNGGGTWILSGANTYTGATTVNSGTLAAGSSTAFGASSPVTLTGAGILDIAGNSVTIGSLNSASANTIVTDSGVAATLTTGALNTAASYIGTITGALALTKIGTGTLTIGGTGTNTYTGLTTVDNVGGGGILQITNTGASPLGAVGNAANGTVVQTGSTLQLAVGGVTIGNEFLTIAGIGAAGTGGALNNQSGTNTFGGPITLSAASTINVTAGVLNLTSGANLTSVSGPFALTLNSAAAATGNLSGIIDSGISTVNKTGAGTWKLIGASTYTGPTIVSGGVLQAGVATVGGAVPTSGAFGINSVVTVTAPGLLDLNGFSNTIGSLSGTGTVDNTSLTAAVLTTGTSASTTFSGNIINTAGTLGLTKVGAATVLTLSGVNSYSGLTTVAQGTLVANSVNALGSGSVAPSATGVAPGITVAAGASLELTFAGVVTGTAGPLTLTIAGTGNALNGVVTPGALVAGANTTYNGSIFVAPGGATISANGFTFTLGTLAPTEFINKNGVNLTLNSGGGAGKIIVNEAITGASASSDLIVTNGATDLNAANSYNGITFIDNRGGVSGVLNTGVANALPTANGRTTMKIDIAGVAGSASTLNIAGTVLNPAGANQAVASLEGLAASKVTLGNNILTIGFGLAALDINGTANANFAGIISGGAGTGGITKDENSTQIFSGLNTYSGPTTVVNGKLQAGVGQAGAAGAFGTNSNVTVGSAATIAGGIAPVLELAGFNETIGALNGLAAAGGFVQNNFGAVGTTATLTLGSGGASGNFGGVLRNAPPVGAVGAGTLTINKIGAGTQIFSGLNTYTGTTTVTAGTLQAGSLQAFGINTVMTVKNGATLELANFSNTIGSLSDGGVFPATGIVSNTLANGPGAAALTIAGINPAGAAGAVGFGGPINDTAATPLALVKNGAGTQSLSGQGNYRGGTTLNAGILDIDASSVAVGAPPSANPVLTGPLGTGTLTINAGEIGTGVGTGGANANNAVGNAVQVNGNFSVSNVVLSPAVLGAPSVNAGLPAVGTAVINTIAFGSSGAAAFTFVSDGVTFTGPVRLNQAGATVITTNSGFLDMSGTISDAFAPGGGLTFSGNTATYLGSSGLGGAIPGILGQADASNTYAGLTTVTGGLVVLGKNSFATAIPGNLQINALAAVFVDSASAGTTANQIAVTSNVLVNGGLDLSGRNQAINNLTGTGVVELDDINGANVGGASVFSVNSGNFGGIIFDNGKGGQLVKNSPGLLILTGQNTYVGNTTVNAGNLQVDGRISSNNTIVNLGGTLSGIGTIGGNVLNGGTVSPGHSVGTLTVKGNYTQTAAGTLIIEVAGSKKGQADLLAVGGAANLNGNLRILRLGGAKLKVGDKVTFLTAGGGVNGKFANVSNPFGANGTIVKTGVVYHANSVALEAQQGSFAKFADGHCEPNGLAVAKALDSIAGKNSQKKLINFLNGEPLGNLCSDFDKIAPEELASVFNIGISLANVQSMNLIRRMDDLQAGAAGFSASGYAMNSGGGPSYSGELAANTGRTANGIGGPEGKGGKEMRAPQEDTRLGVFVTGVGEFTNIGNTANARGYDLTTGGFTLGVDYKVTPNFAIGINAGYARTGADLNNNGRVTVDGAKVGLYATYFTGTGFYVDAAVNGGYNSYDTRRSALKGFATGSTKGAEFNALLATGYDWKTGGLRIGPTANVQYTNVGIDSFREHGSLAPLNITSKNGESLRTALGMKASYDWQVGGVVIRPEVRAAWQHEFGDSSFALDSRFANGAGNTFTVRGPAIGDDSLLLGAGVAVLWNERTSTYVYYDGELLRNNYSSNNVSGGVRLSF